MQTQHGGVSLADLKAVAARRWWLFLLPFLTITLGMVLIALLLPDIYRAETVILVDPAKIPERYVAPISTVEVKDRLQTLSQQIMSRTRLEQVIRSLGLWREDWHDQRRMERRVASLRRRIDVRVSGNDSFVIGFEGRDPALVQQVTNRLAALFIDENSKVRAERAEGTAAFIGLQLEDVRRRLEAKEAEIRAYREAYLDELPEQKDAYMRTLDAFELRLVASRESARRLTERRALVQQQLAAVAAGDGGEDGASSLREELVRLRAELRALESQYTDRHPDVQAARRRIAELRTLLRSGKGMDLPAAPADAARDPLVVGFRRELDQISLDLSSAMSERRNLERQIQEVQRKVANMPRREQEYAALTRDLENLRETYRSLLNKRIQAEMAEDLERKQAGATFTVLDPAEQPKTPVKPNRTRILLLGLLFGLGTAGGAVYLGEALDQSVRTVEDLKQAYDLPILGAVPDLTEDDAKGRRRMRRAYLRRTAETVKP